MSKGFRAFLVVSISIYFGVFLLLIHSTPVSANTEEPSTDIGRLEAEALEVMNSENTIYYRQFKNVDCEGMVNGDYRLVRFMQLRAVRAYCQTKYPDWNSRVLEYQRHRQELDRKVSVEKPEVPWHKSKSFGQLLVVLPFLLVFFLIISIFVYVIEKSSKSQGANVVQYPNLTDSNEVESAEVQNKPFYFSTIFTVLSGTLLGICSTYFVYSYFFIPSNAWGMYAMFVVVIIPLVLVTLISIYVSLLKFFDATKTEKYLIAYGFVMGIILPAVNIYIWKAYS